MKHTKLFLLVVLFLASCATPATSAPTLTPTFTPQPTATQTSIPTSTPTVTPAPTQVGGGSGRLIFTYNKDNKLVSGNNVFVANIDGENLTLITKDNNFNHLKDISPDGTKVLISSTSDHEGKDATLYLVNLNSPDSKIKLADGLPNYYGRNSTAKWLDDKKIIYIGNGETGFGIYLINTDGTNPINIYKVTDNNPKNKPFEILAIGDDRIYWDAQVTTTQYYISWSSLDGIEQNPLKFNGKQMFFDKYGGPPSLAFSPDSTKIAWVEHTASDHNYLHIASISDIDNPYTLDAEPLTSSIILKWWPDGTKILVFDKDSVLSFVMKGRIDSASDLFGIYEVPVTPNSPIINYHLDVNKMMPFKTETDNNSTAYITADIDLYDISPDGRQIICMVYELNSDGEFERKLSFLDLKTHTFSEASGFTFSNKAIIMDVRWIP